MVFNLTSCGRNRRRAAFTLAEYLVATSIGLLVLTAALVLWAYGSKVCASLLGYVDLSATSKNALARISQQIRNTKDVQSCCATQLVVRLPDPDSTNLNLVTFNYDSAKQTLSQTTVKANNAVERTTLLTECTNFEFSIYQRVPIVKSFQLRTNAWNTNTAKVVQMQWTCSRKITGDKSSVESQVSSKVVIRNEYER